MREDSIVQFYRDQVKSCFQIQIINNDMIQHIFKSTVQNFLSLDRINTDLNI
jgi:hypothetical protein